MEDSIQKSGKRVVERLDSLGILTDKTLAIHGIHLDDNEMSLLAGKDAMVAHCPESNMKNGVGVARVQDMLDKGICVGLGTDGFTFNMLREMKAAYLLHKSHAGDPRAMGMDSVLKLLVDNNSRIVERMLGVRTGRIEVGAPADIVLAEYHPPTQMDLDNYPYHLLFGLSSHNIDTTIINGKVLMRDKRLVGIDEEKLAEECRKHAEVVWERLE